MLFNFILLILDVFLFFYFVEPLESHDHLELYERVVYRAEKSQEEGGQLESELNKAKLALTIADQLKEDLVVVEEAWDASYAAATQAQNEAAATGAQRDKALQDLAELQEVACRPIYEQVFNRGIN